MRAARSGTSKALLVGVAATALGACFGDGRDCDRVLGPGEESGGVSPDRTIAPLLGDFAGTLTWTIPGRTTTLHLRIEQPSASSMHSDCKDAPDFEVPLSIHFFSDDGLIDTAPYSDTAKIDGAGHVLSPSHVDASASWDVLRRAGVAPQDIISGPGLAITIPIVNLAPTDGEVETREYPDPPQSLGTIHFAPR